MNTQTDWLTEWIAQALHRLDVMGFTPRIIALYGAAHFTLGMIVGFMVTAFIWNTAVAGRLLIFLKRLLFV